ncbi:MAG: response regulator [Lachnospiraceae bacterium]|nr:response regulator [Lachnospiraceae bacterium]
MNRINLHRFIMTIITIAAIGLTIDSIQEGWEFWVNPILILGTIGLWVLHFMQRHTEDIREAIYLGFGMFMALFHGVHETSLYDVCTVILLMFVLFALYEKIYVLDLILIEYFLIMLAQFVFVVKPENLTLDAVTVSRLVLQLVIVLSVYSICRMNVTNRIEQREEVERQKADIEAYDSDIEDFLSNISHELRTPVNVVNGMSELMLKKGAGSEAAEIKNAGIRLAYQIEDIQDYTECNRSKVMLEEEDYISTSLINDVVTSFRLVDKSRDIELVVDLSPEVPMMMTGDIKKLHKIFRHLLENAVKFTKHGGIFVRMYTEPEEYGVNLCIEMTDTGIGMDLKDTRSVARGMYQANKRRDRSSGGIGLGLFIVHGFAHRMGGFVKIESAKNAGTTVRVTVPQKVKDAAPCLSLSGTFEGDILFHVKPDKYKVPRVRDFYRMMAGDLAAGIHVPLYSAESVNEIERLMEKLNVTHIFMGEEEYKDNPEYFDKLSRGDMVVTVSASEGFSPNLGSNVMVMPKPLYGYPVIKILNEGKDAMNIEFADNTSRPSFEGVRALVVDDEPMNLVVATGIFRDYQMDVDTASSGKESVMKVRNNEYDIVFMDHMMPEMDGVEAMKQIKMYAAETRKELVVVALTANAVSGAREMFMREGFDGFIAKPINTADFERVMIRVLPGRKGGRS